MQESDIYEVLRLRFHTHMRRHPDLEWEKIQAKIAGNPERLVSLRGMESTGGEPDVIGYDSKTDEYIFCDCSAESPTGRRSLCYDQLALDERKADKPKGNVLDMATSLRISLLTESQYRDLQEIEPFDTKTSSWIETPTSIREL